MCCSNPFHSKTLRVLAANSRKKKSSKDARKGGFFFLLEKFLLAFQVTLSSSSSHPFGKDFFPLCFPKSPSFLFIFSKQATFSLHFLQTGNFFSSSVLQLCRRRKMAIDIEEKEGRKFNFRDVVSEAK